MKIKKELILFDLDGVLIDSKKNMQFAWEAVQDEFKLNIPFESYFQFIGMPFQDILKSLKIKKNKKRIEYCFRRKSAELIHQIPFFEGVEETIELLKYSKKFKIGIVTSKDKLRTNSMISKLPNFDVVSCPEKKLRGKPNPDQLLSALTKCNCDPRSAIYVGDMEVDKEAAKRSGIDFIHAEWGYGEVKNSISIKNMKELINILS